MTHRVIARLDVKGTNLIKGIQLEGLRVMGPISKFARQYYSAGVDEIIYMDAVASLYGRNSLQPVIEDASSSVFVPMTVGGAVRSVEDTRNILRSGADKIAMNTGAIKNPQIISEISQTFGSQCMVLSIEAKKIGSQKWECYIDNGREHTGFDPIEWASRSENLGAGEILLTSIDQEGTRKGFDIELIQAVCNQVSIPVIASGGFGNPDHALELFRKTPVSAVAIADAFHYGRTTICELKSYLIKNGVSMRPIDSRGVIDE